MLLGRAETGKEAKATLRLEEDGVVYPSLSSPFLVGVTFLEGMVNPSSSTSKSKSAAGAAARVSTYKSMKAVFQLVMISDG